MTVDKIINSTLLQYFKAKLVALIPTKTSDLTNDSGYITSSDLPEDSTIITLKTWTSSDISS